MIALVWTGTPPASGSMLARRPVTKGNTPLFALTWDPAVSQWYAYYRGARGSLDSRWKLYTHEDLAGMATGGWEFALLGMGLAQ